jgi:superfamily II DNA or RNA helicase
MIDRARYQTPAVEQVSQLLAAGRHTCLVSPTGSGKSVMGALVVRAAPNETWAVMTHREEIRDQLQQHLPGVPVLSWQEQAAKRTVRPGVTRLWLDECHHGGSTGPWGLTCREDFPNARRFGTTATPQRGDGQPLAGVFDDTRSSSRLVLWFHAVFGGLGKSLQDWLNVP